MFIVYYFITRLARFFFLYSINLYVSVFSESSEPDRGRNSNAEYLGCSWKRFSDHGAKLIAAASSFLFPSMPSKTLFGRGRFQAFGDRTRRFTRFIFIMRQTCIAIVTEPKERGHYSGGTTREMLCVSVRGILNTFIGLVLRWLPTVNLPNWLVLAVCARTPSHVIKPCVHYHFYEAYARSGCCLFLRPARGRDAAIIGRLLSRNYRLNPALP